MKALIMSDSHGLEDEVILLKERHQDADLFIHCGDSELDFGHEALKSLEYVKGNCDFDSRFPEVISHKFGDYQFLITHGHLFNVKMTLMNLQYKAEEEEADIICFGHSHIAGSELIDGRLFINPGSIRLPKGIREKTYVLLEAENRDVSVSFYTLEGKPLETLSQTYHLG
ncbi:metallophosphoesterase [Peribacillus kribbensis]|uniref:metallophosphoesterase n=1 Tax=Peribacillus kribbensis TaxID=356658 RepID=UPI00040B57F1|nr:metallophosphoesterase [Peribacillus kribbensis]